MSNNNALDFELGCITPGSANIVGSGNCSVTSVSAVPLPAAAWLFGSGIIGLVGLARRKWSFFSWQLSVGSKDLKHS